MSGHYPWPPPSTKKHCLTEHGRLLPDGFEPAPGVTWDMVHHLLHLLAKWHKWRR